MRGFTGSYTVQLRAGRRHPNLQQRQLWKNVVMFVCSLCWSCCVVCLLKRPLPHPYSLQPVRQAGRNLHTGRQWWLVGTKSVCGLVSSPCSVNCSRFHRSNTIVNIISIYLFQHLSLNVLRKEEKSQFEDNSPIQYESKLFASDTHREVKSRLNSMDAS